MTQHISIDSAHLLSDLVKLAISNSILESHQEIQFKIDQEQVLLTGIVSSYYQKQLAQESVSRVIGSRQINNRLLVEPVRRTRDDKWIPANSHRKSNGL